MADQRTIGVILRTRPLTETSVIVQWLTADAGRIATVAKGARRAKSPFRGKVDLFHEADLTYRRSRRSDLHTLVEVRLRERFPALRADWQRLSQAGYAVGLIELTTESDTPLPETWSLFRGFLGLVGNAPRSPLGVLALELKHLEDLGLLPDLRQQALPEESRQLAERLLRSSWTELAAAETPRPAWEPLAHFLRGFLIYHVGRIPKGRADALSPASNAGFGDEPAGLRPGASTRVK